MAPLPRPSHYTTLSSTLLRPTYTTYTTHTTPLRLPLRPHHPQPHPQPHLQPQPHLRTLHTTRALASSSHESPYEPPTGNLWGVPAGQTYQKEGWENVWIYGFFGSLLFGVVGYAFKVDTSIETWALEEAKRRLQAEGILPEEDNEQNRA